MDPQSTTVSSGERSPTLIQYGALLISRSAHRAQCPRALVMNAAARRGSDTVAPEKLLPSGPRGTLIQIAFLMSDKRHRRRSNPVQFWCGDTRGSLKETAAAQLFGVFSEWFLLLFFIS